MVPELIVTVCPLVIEVEFKLMSDPDVPTDKPLTGMLVPPPSLMRAATAVPVLVAVPDLGTPLIVITPLLSVNDGLLNVILTSTVAMAAVPISSVAADALASIAVMTAVMRLVFNDVT